MNYFLILLASVWVLSHSVRGQSLVTAPSGDDVCDNLLGPNDSLVTKLDFTNSTVVTNTLHNDTNGEIRYKGEL